MTSTATMVPKRSFGIANTSFIAAWFEGGKDDPKVRLLRMDPAEAHVWLNENSLLAGVKMLLGVDPKQAYEDKTGDIDIA